MPTAAIIVTFEFPEPEDYGLPQAPVAVLRSVTAALEEHGIELPRQGAFMTIKKSDLEQLDQMRAT